MRAVDLDYRYIRAFMVTARHLNFSRAAEELNIAQSAVSRQIKLLEDGVGHQLIVRSSKKVILTDKGQALLNLVEKFEQDVTGIFLGQVSRTLKIGILHGLLENWFNDIITDYARSKKLSLVVEVQPMERLKEKLLSGQYDLVFTSENIQSELVSSLRVFDEKMILISKSEINLKDIHDYPWVVYNENDNLFHVFKKHTRQMIAVNSITSVVNLVKKGVGVAIVPDHLLKPTDNLKTYDVKGLPKASVFISTLNFQTLPEPLKGLVEMIKKKALN
ncbi:MAG: LysR family transcriptional regulator [Proteobacteria bacterium]|nr:LysR family transcriptional regulator [Pseudomonadota bacterium]